MPSVVFAGSKVKTLKDILTLNGKSDIISSTVDPTASAVDAPIGSLLINQTSGKLYRKLDAGSSVNWEEVGSGVGGINYILNPSAEVNTTGWATYADAAGTAPVDGTGGSPNVTWTRSTTSPLRGVADFNFVKDAANRQGQGVSYDFTIDEADKAKVLSVTFDYEVLSGTYADGDLTVYLIADPTGTPVVIQPAGYTVLSATVGTTMREVATFQTQATGTSYRLCFHVASTSASAYTLAIDNVVVGPQQTVLGAPVSDWVSYTPVWTSASNPQPSIGNGSISGRWRRVGDSAEIQLALTTGTTTTYGTGAWKFSIPSGLGIDLNKTVIADGAVLGFASLFNGSLTRGGQVVNVNSTSVLEIEPDNSTGTRVNPTTPFTWSSGMALRFEAFLPISGWSSNTVMSDSTDTRVVAARASRANINQGGITPNFSAVLMEFFSTSGGYQYDTHNSFLPLTYKYKIPVSGFYSIKSLLSFSSTNVLNNRYFAFIDIDGSNVLKGQEVRPTAATDFATMVAGTVYCLAGQEVSVKLFGAGNNSAAPLTLVGGDESSYFIIERLSGPATIASSESVVMRAVKTTGTSATGWQPVASWDASPLVDTHAGFNPTTGVYTIPVSGKYLVTANITFNSNATGTRAIRFETPLLVDLGYGNIIETNTTGTTTAVVCSHVLNFVAGNQIRVAAFQNGGAGLAYGTGTGENAFHIVRVGN